MKTIKILFICMVAAIFAHAQESVPPYVMDGVEVTPPKFTAVKYTAPAIENALKTHIAQNFDYKPDFGDALEGTEVVQFIINTDGTLSDIEIVNSVSPSADKEIKRVLQATDNMWIPGKNNGVPVAMEKEIAIQIKHGSSESLAYQRDFTEIARGFFTKGSEKLLVEHKTKQAIRQFKVAVRYQPYDKSTLYMLALCELDLNNSKAAQAYVERIQKLGGIDEVPIENFAENIKNIDSYNVLTQLLTTK